MRRGIDNEASRCLVGKREESDEDGLYLHVRKHPELGFFDAVCLVPMSFSRCLFGKVTSQMQMSFYQEYEIQ
jgi:hypothetical protein